MPCGHKYVSWLGKEKCLQPHAVASNVIKTLCYVLTFIMGTLETSGMWQLTCGIQQREFSFLFIYSSQKQEGILAISFRYLHIDIPLKPVQIKRENSKYTCINVPTTEVWEYEQLTNQMYLKNIISLSMSRNRSHTLELIT
uniref:Uncharacterized protein n=1 Tax=Glossina pallidipes TaxID=7398 RepID=A0A1A9Z812_GLOPL